MRFSLSRGGLYWLIRSGSLNADKKPVGFKVKPVEKMLFSERYGHRRGVKIGPLYFGLYS